MRGKSQDATRGGVRSACRGRRTQPGWLRQLQRVLGVCCVLGGLLPGRSFGWEADLSGRGPDLPALLREVQARPDLLGEAGWWRGLDDAQAAALLPELGKDPLLRQMLARVFVAGRATDGALFALALPLSARAFAEASTPAEDERVASLLVLCAASAQDELFAAALSAFERVVVRRAQLDDQAGLERFAAAWRRAGGSELDADMLLLRRALAARPSPGARADELFLSAEQGVERLSGVVAERARAGLLQLRALAALRAFEEARLAQAPDEIRASLFEAVLARCAAWRAALDAAASRAGRGGGSGQALQRGFIAARRAAAAAVELLARLPHGAARLRCDERLARCAGELLLASQSAQLEASRGGSAAYASLDAVLEDSSGAFAILYDGGPLSARASDARLAMASLLHELAPDEHFAPPCVLDEGARAEALRVQTARHALLVACAEAQAVDLGRRAGFLAASIAEREERALEAELEPRRELERIEWRRSQLFEALGPDGSAMLQELRTPSWLALEAARLMRDEGRAAEARSVLEGLRGVLDADGRTRNWLWGLEMLAAVESALGSTLSDEGEGDAAQAQLETSAARLEELVRLLEDRADAPRLRRTIENQLSAVLVSLAVNANVKRHDPEAALAWFEKAWALRQDETMRVLGACYRARAGRDAEARRLLEGVVPSPAVHYNLACAHALLGDTDAALEFLRLELSEAGAVPGAVARRKEWARADPDLKSLRDDARFQTLVAP